MSSGGGAKEAERISATRRLQAAVRARSARRTFGSKDRRRTKTKTRVDVETPAAEALGVEEQQADDTAGVTKSLKAMAEQLWASDYQPLIEAERRRLSALGLTEAALHLKAAAPPSTYTQRGLVRHPEQKLAQVLDQTGYAAAVAVRQANQQHYPFTVCARSAAKITRMTRTKDWKESLYQRQTLSKNTALKLIDLMMECKPACRFGCSRTFALHIFDQCYKKKGKSRAQHRAAEKVDASGAATGLGPRGISKR